MFVVNTEEQTLSVTKLKPLEGWIFGATKPAEVSRVSFARTINNWRSCREGTQLNTLVWLNKAATHSHITSNLSLIVKDPRAARPYLFSDGQNMYNRVVLVCTVNVYIPTSLGRRPILRYKVLQVP